jgi:hypothetical protein
MFLYLATNRICSEPAHYVGVSGTMFSAFDFSKRL